VRDIPLLNTRPQEWYCPNCDVTDTTVPMPPGTSQYHTCAGLHGLSAPLIRAGLKVKVEATEREDYLNGDNQAAGDDGRVYMNVTVTREDGTDVTVFAPTARADMRIP
jgi:hypothetical protein